MEETFRAITMTRTLDEASSQPGDLEASFATDLESSLSLPAAVQSYFDALNQKDFDRAADLFNEQGQLIPPFEKPIEGKAAIAHYLATEASEMTLMPLTCTQERSESEPSQTFRVEGRVKHSLFLVNVAWIFNLTATDEIESVQIKLLASLKELLKVKR